MSQTEVPGRGTGEPITKIPDAHLHADYLLGDSMAPIALAAAQPSKGSPPHLIAVAISRPETWFNCGCTNTLVVPALSNRAIMVFMRDVKWRKKQIFIFLIRKTAMVFTH
jgi:hypothetical protein